MIVIDKGFGRHGEMKETLINFIGVSSVKSTAPTLPEHKNALAKQIGIRWLYLLRNCQFCLPDFSILQVRLELCQDLTGSSMAIDLSHSPSAGNLRLVHCLVKEIPEESDTVNYSRVVNEAIYSSLKHFWPNDQSENSRKLVQVRELVEEKGNSFPIMFRNACSRNLTAELQIKPCGVFGLGGEIYVSMSNSKTGATVVRKLLEFSNFELVIACCKHLKLTKDELRISGSDFWHRTNPDMVSEITISVPAFMSATEDESEWLKIDLVTLRERLAQPISMHPLLQGIDLSIFTKGSSL